MKLQEKTAEIEKAIKKVKREIKKQKALSVG